MLMDVYHGTWLPAVNAGFENHGQFIFWIERQYQKAKSSKSKKNLHPHHLSKTLELANFLSTDLSLTKVVISQLNPTLVLIYMALPSDQQQPLPSPEMAQLTGHYLPDEYDWQIWEVNGLGIEKPLLLLRELQVMARFNPPHFRLGSDLLFWVQYAQQLRNMIRQHQFIPLMKCYQSARKGAKPVVYTGWSPFGRNYEQSLQQFAAAMPGICTTATGKKPKVAPIEQPECLDRIELLRHFSEQQLEQLITEIPVTQQLLKQLGNSWLIDALGYRYLGGYGRSSYLKDKNHESDLTLDDWQAWYHWQRGLSGQVQERGFVLGLRLQPADLGNEDDWWLHFFVQSAQDPSLKIDLAEWWTLSAAKQTQWLKQLGGQQFERHLLVNMGHAARICPLLWQGMESTHPAGLELDLQAGL